MKKLLSLAVFLLLLAFLQAGIVSAAEKFYCTEKVKGYDKGNFVIMQGDDVNLRQEPETGRILRVLQRHTLLQVLDRKGDWYQVLADGTEGYVYAPFTEACRKDMLTQEDFALGYLALNSRFDKERLEQSLGKCLSSKKENGRYYYTFSNITVGTDKKRKNNVYYKISDPKIITMRGVSVGDDSARAIGQYGTPSTVVYEAAGVCYEYYFQDQDDDDYRFAIEVSRSGKIEALIIEKQK